MRGCGSPSTPTPSWSPHGWSVDGTGEWAMMFMDDLASRLTNRVRLPPATAIRPTWRPSRARSEPGWTTRCWSRSTGAAPGERQGPLQPGRVHRRPEAANRRRPGYRPCKHVLCRTKQPQHSDLFAPDDEVDQCLLKEGREPRSRDGLAFPVLQFVRVHKTLRKRLRWRLASQSDFGR